MLTREDDVDAHALRRQGWTISAIARHLGHDRKTIRAYLTGGRVAGERVSTAEDPLGPFVAYLRQRLRRRPACVGDGAVRRGRRPRLRPVLPELHPRPADAPAAAALRAVHGLTRPGPRRHRPPAWGGGAVGLARAARPTRATGRPARRRTCWSGRCRRSGKWRAVLADAEDQAHLVEALHAVSARLGGLPKRWRFDRMATVCHPATGRVTAIFAAVAKHYGVHVDICPSRHGNRKGSVEKSNHSAAQRWWRTLPDDLTRRAGPGVAGRVLRPGR